MTNKQHAMKTAYDRSNDRYLWHVYGRCSRAKEQAYEEIEKECYKLDGYDIRITSHNSSFFSMAYRYMLNDVEMLVYHTAYNRFEFPY